MPVSSASSRSAVSRKLSPSSWLPVTDCQKPGRSARSMSNTCKSGVWITTSTDTGILNFFARDGAELTDAFRSNACRPRLARPGLFDIAQADVQFPQLLFVHWTGCLAHQILRPLCLRERDDVAYRFAARHECNDAVKAERQAPMGRRAELESIEQEAEFFAGFLRSDVQRTEHPGLNLLSVYAHRASADFPAVQHHVVGLGERGAGVGIEERLVTVHGAGERMMQRVPALFVLVPLEHREVDDPQRTPVLAGVTLLVADFHAQRAQSIVDYLGLVSAEENEVAI